MNLNNQSSIQISEENKFLGNVKELYDLCKQIIDIDQHVLKFLPASTLPYRTAFQNLIKINVIQRQKRQELSFHLTSAYFSTSPFQRQMYLHDDYFHFISKLKQIPLKIKILLLMDNITKKINQSIDLVQKSSYSQVNKNVCQQISNKIYNPNQIIKQSEQCIQTFIKYKKISQDYEKKQQNKQAQQLDKSQLIQKYKHNQFKVQKDLISLIIWKLQACILACTTFLQKSNKKSTLNFIKSTKSILKMALADPNLIIRLYHLSLKNILKKQNWIKNEEQHIYLQLQLKKLIHNYKHLLNKKNIDQIENVFNKIKQRLDHEILSDNFLKSAKNKGIMRQSEIQETQYEERRQARINYGNQKQSNKNNSINGGNKFNNRQNFNKRFNVSLTQRSNFSKYFHPQQAKLPLNQNFKCKSLHGSQSIRKIKQYQLSLKKQKQAKSEIKRNLTLRNPPSLFNISKKVSTQRIDQKQDQKRQEQVENNKSNLKSQKHQHQTSLLVQKKKPLRKSFFQTFFVSKGKNKNIEKNPSKIYLSIKDKACKQMMITQMGLQNEMFAIPQLIYEKPKITYEEILNDAKTMQQRQNDSESNVINQTVSQIYIQKVQINLEYSFIMNDQIHSFNIIKTQQYSQHFSCILKYHSSQITCHLKFNENKLFSMKQIKSIIQSTDLFFELMQTGIKSFKYQPTQNLASNIKNINQLQKTDPSGYYAHMSCLNHIIQIGNYLQPYIYWYFSKTNKINGTFLQKRKRMEMSDPLKFSINLQFFKKNNYQGCVQQFQTVRNKKGLKQCISYLSQGRQILCKFLIKRNKNYYIQVIELNPKYLNKFYTNNSKYLIFPILKVYKRTIKIDQNWQCYQSFLQNLHKQRGFNQLLRKNIKRNQTLLKQQRQNFKKINMRNIFTNQECNRIIINNLNKNYIQRRFIQRFINFSDQSFFINNQCQVQTEKRQFLWKSNITTQNLEPIVRKNKQFIPSDNNDQRQKKKPVNTNNYSNNSENKMQYVEENISVNNDKVGNNLQAIKISIQNLVFEFGSPQLQLKIMNKESQKNIQNKPILQTSNSIMLHSKLQNYRYFLKYLKQSYSQSSMIYLQSQKYRIIKINNKFYSLTTFKIQFDSYILILRDNLNFKQWILYFSQRMLRNFNYLTYKIQQKCLQEQSFFDNLTDNQIFQNIKININPKGIIKHTNKQRLPQISNISLKSQQINQAQPKQNFLFSPIYNSQCTKFYLTFIETAYYNYFGIKRYNSQVYFTNFGHKSNIFSTVVNNNKVLFKKVMVIKISQNHNTKQGFHNSSKTKMYIYISGSLDMSFLFWRLDIYNPYNQQKYVVIIPASQINIKTQNLFNNIDFQNKISKQNEQKRQWQKILTGNQLKINFQSSFINLSGKIYKLYQTFGQLTIPSFQNSHEMYFKQNQQNFDNNCLNFNIKGNKKQKINYSMYSLYKNSGKVQLLKWKQTVILLVLNYEKNVIYKSEIDQNPYHIFANIFSQFSYQQTKNFMYQNLFKRTYRKLQRNGVVLETIEINQINQQQTVQIEKKEQNNLENQLKQSFFENQNN